MINNERVLLTKKDLCKYLKCSIGSVDNFMKNGRIKYIKIGKMVRFDKDEIDNSLGIIKKIEFKNLVSNGED